MPNVSFGRLGVRRPLHRIVADLARSGASVNAPNHNGAAPLHRAVRKGHALVAEQLVLHGADLHLQNHRGQSPLQQASVALRPRLLAAVEERGRVGEVVPVQRSGHGQNALKKRAPTLELAGERARERDGSPSLEESAAKPGGPSERWKANQTLTQTRTHTQTQTRTQRWASP